MSVKDATNGAAKNSFVTGQNSEGVEFRGTLLKMTRLMVVFEFHNLAAVLRYSESLPEFSIIFNGRTLYSGKAVVRNLLNTGPSAVVCEATLNENSWNMFDLATANGQAGGWREEFQHFATEWQKCYRVLPEFKAVMSDMESFLRALQLWLNRIELELASHPTADRAALEQNILNELAASAGHSIDVFVDQFEGMAAKLDDELAVIHQAYMRRQLHPLVLCSPFAQRCYYKPLGYAGDYEMVGMMLRAPYEGASLFAKIVNMWLLNQSPAAAHRNRIDYLVKTLVQFTMQRAAVNQRPRILTIGCGPAQEIQRFLTDQPVSSHADITLLDFNEETLRYTGAVLAGLKAKHNRNTNFSYIKKSVHHLLREGGRELAPDATRYDFVYCAGLFDYLSNQVCKRLMNAFYDMLAPGGLLVATNVSDVMNPVRPFRYSMEYMLDWHLIYRDGRGMAELTPDGVERDDVIITTEDIGVNVFIEVRKPDHG